MSVGRDAGHVRNVGSAAEQQVRSARHVMSAVFGVTLGGVVSLSGSDGQQQHGSDSNDALHGGFGVLFRSGTSGVSIDNALVGASGTGLIDSLIALPQFIRPRRARPFMIGCEFGPSAHQGGARLR